MKIDSRIKFHDGNSIPQLGLGVWKTGQETEKAVLAALKVGYRHIDTAAIYYNEEAVGIAIKKSKIPRKDIFVTTKLWNDDHGDPEKALRKSLKKLQLDYVDLYLIHWPVPERKETWKILQQFKKEGLCRSLGVSNFTIRHLKELPGPKPVIDQVEFNPFLYQKELLDYCTKNGILIEAYSPLSHGTTLKDKKLGDVAKKYDCSPAQIMIRWGIQKGVVIIPKSKNPDRIKENGNVFNFKISDADMKALDDLNRNLRTCWDPTNIP